MSNSRRNFLPEETREEVNRRITELAHPSELKAANPIQQKYFKLMWNNPGNNIGLAKQMQKEMAEQSSVNVNSKLD